MSTPTSIPPISEQEKTPLVEALLAKIEEYAGMILMLREQIQLLRDEIAVLKGQKPRPKIPPNRLNQNPDFSEKNNTGNSDGGKRPGSAKKNKTKTLEVNEIRKVHPEHIPLGAKAM
jgi:hypothetical protein